MGSLADSVTSAANSIGVTIPDSEYAEYATLLERMESAIQTVSEMDGSSPSRGTISAIISTSIDANMPHKTINLFRTMI